MRNSSDWVHCIRNDLPELADELAKAQARLLHLPGWNDGA